MAADPVAVFLRLRRLLSAPADGSLLEQGGQAVGLALGEEALEARLENHSSLECAEFMWRAKTGEFDEVRRAIQ